MASSDISGPAVSYGQKTAAASNADLNTQAGPSMFYQGVGIIDPRWPYGAGTGPLGRNGQGTLPAVAASLPFTTVEAIPWTAAAAALVAAATATSGTAMTAVSASGAGIYVNIPIVPNGLAVNAANVVKVSMVGPGTSSCTTVATSASITSVRNGDIVPGQWVCIPDAVAAGTPLIAQVLTATQGTTDGNSFTLTLSVAAGASVTNATMFLMDSTGTGVVPYIAAGRGYFLDPPSGLSRGFSVTSNSVSDTGWSVTVRGYDFWNNALTCTLAVGANTIAYSLKCFKSFVSVTPTNTGSTVGTLSIGTSDVFCLNMRADNFDAVTAYWASVFGTVGGFIAADATITATAATGDIYGTFQGGAVGGGSGFGANASNGTAANIAANTGRRLVISVTPPLRKMVTATYANAASIFGVAQYAG